MSNNEFKLDDEKISFISKSFDVHRDFVKTLYDVYQQIQGNLSEQYLAHVIRTMEQQLRKITGNYLFQITVDKMSEPSTAGVGCASYIKGCYFSICYNPNMDEKQLRVCIAHELGHLYLIEYLNNKGHDLDEKSLLEPLSSIFGVFAMMDKNDFYYNIQGKKLMHSSFKALIDDFLLLNNRDKGVVNLS